MTKEELKQHCEKQVKMCEEWAKGNGREPSGRIYEEHKLTLDLINELQDKSYELWKESYEEEHLRNIRLEEKIKALEQPTNDCKIFGTKENCFGGATENECEHCDYKIQKLEQHSEDCVSRTQAIEWIENLRQMDKCFGNYEDDYFPLSEVIDRLKNVPPVTPKIPTFEDCVSRQVTLNAIIKELCIKDESYLLQSEKAIYNVVKNMPPVTPTHGTCKDCTNYVVGALDEEICIRGHELIHKDFYCADFEKRDNNKPKTYIDCQKCECFRNPDYSRCIKCEKRGNENGSDKRYGNA